jgi:c-di-GMP-binding flagellar brake protein YcgR
MNSSKFFGIEQRKFVRIDTKLVVKIEEISSIESPNKVFTKNISEGGMLFEYNKQYDIGTVLSLVLRLPELEKTIECYGKVVRVEDIGDGELFDIGIMFINVAPEVAKTLVEFIGIRLKKDEYKI